MNRDTQKNPKLQFSASLLIASEYSSANVPLVAFDQLELFALLLAE
jgi:hypothetical protein